MINISSLQTLHLTSWPADSELPAVMLGSVRGHDFIIEGGGGGHYLLSVSVTEHSFLTASELRLLPWPASLDVLGALYHSEQT